MAIHVCLQEPAVGEEVFSLEDTNLGAANQGCPNGIAVAVSLVIFVHYFYVPMGTSDATNRNTSASIGAEEDPILASSVIAQTREEPLPLLLIERGRVENFEELGECL